MIIDSQYKVLEKFGEDAWAYTYKVKDLRTEKIYALKIFKKIDSKKLYNKFSAEDMHHITNMHHPNLVDVENFGNENDSIYYLSEYFPGISFAEFELTSRNHQELFDIIVQICYGLDTIHSQNILHRNIKPSNILFTKKEGKIDLKLLDYGFVATEDKAKRKKSRKEHLYISPEVLLGNQSTIQSDLFSLGITLYKVLTGKFPYSQDQIRSILINPKITLIPQFPSELNKKISTEIETIILKLIEINAENRYSSSQEIINYINEVQSKKYHISSKWKIINGIIINGYIAREKYTHDLLDILESDKQKNSIITIYSKDGMGKQNTLSLYRFHLLTGKYLIFDYTCSEENQDPFFALIKEFREYLKKIKTFNKKNLSMKFRRFLDSSNFDKDSTVNEPNDLQKDFQNAKNFLKHISKKKPLIFIIRSGEYLTQDSLKFVNYIKEELNNFPFTIIIGTKNQKTLNILNPDYKISLPQLTKAEARIFVFHLIHKRLPNQFLEHLLRKTNGIPKFIKYTLVDLIETRKIWKDNNFDFSYNFKNYRLHKSLQKLLFQRISSLENDSSDYKELISKLSVANMPLTKELILQILDNISASKYYAFIEACLENEVLIQQGKNYLFTFEEIRENLYRNSNKQTVSDISKRIITFYNSQNIDNTILKKLVVIAEEIEDFSKLRELRLQLYNYHKNHQDYYKAFIEISNIIKLDYSSKCTVTNQNMMKDLDYLLESAEITGSIKQALSIVDINDFPDIFEKFYTLGFFYLNIDNYKLAKENFEKAKNYVNTGRQKIRLTLTMISLYNRFNDLP
ncbi:MAG: serine/threonine-protein kinase, partial [Candidatus Cloacimonadota bacterium]|nr:serine/threonine-protein kinase [Candidatus Cloacimonadota bacterium]